MSSNKPTAGTCEACKEWTRNNKWVDGLYLCKKCREHDR